MNGTPFAVALLLGGQSQRMGKDKALLRVTGEKELWLDRWELLRSLPASEWMLSCRPDQNLPVPDHGVLVHDDWPGSGPLGAILSCLRRSTAPRLLVLAVDMPAVTRDILMSLLGPPGHSPPPLSATGKVFQREGRWEPLAAVYPRTMLPAGERQLAGGNGSLQSWIREAGPLMTSTPLPPAWNDSFRNLNDPRDWEEWQAAQVLPGP